MLWYLVANIRILPTETYLQNPKCTKHFLKIILGEFLPKYSFFTQKSSVSIFCSQFLILDNKIKRIRNLILPTRTNFCPHNCEFEESFCQKEKFARFLLL